MSTSAAIARVLDRLLAEKKPDNALHFYLGHAGWTPGQLTLEIEREEWYIVDADPAVIFSADPESIWKRLIEKIDPSGIIAGSDWPADSPSRSRNVGWVSVFCVTHQALRSNTTHLFNECLAAHPVGYGTNGVPDPPYIDSGTA